MSIDQITQNFMLTYCSTLFPLLHILYNYIQWNEGNMGRCRKTSRLRMDMRFECDRFFDSLQLPEQSSG